MKLIKELSQFYCSQIFVVIFFYSNVGLALIISNSQGQISKLIVFFPEEIYIFVCLYVCLCVLQ